MGPRYANRVISGSGISVADAARQLGVSESTVRNWLTSGRLRGARGAQPSRPRWRVLTDEQGRFVDHDGIVVPASRSTAHVEAELEALRQRVGALERREPGHADGDFRVAALQLSLVMEHQRQAFELQLESTKRLNMAVTEQSAIIAGLLTSGTDVLLGQPPS